MLEIPLFVLVLHIGFNAALYYSDYNRNPLIPSARFINTRQTRQLLDSDLPVSSRGFPNSDGEQSDSEYFSSEESSYPVQPLQNLSYKKQNNYLKYKSRPDNDVSLDYVPTGRFGSKYLDNLLSSSSVSHRTDSNFKQAYLKHRPSNLRQSQNRKYYRKENDNLSLEASSIDSTSTEDVLPTEEDSSYLRSLSSFVVKPNNRRAKNRKYYRKGDNLSLEVSPIDKSDLDEDTHLPISRVNNLAKIKPQNERQNGKNYKNHKYDLRFHTPPAKDGPDGHIDTVFFVTDDIKPDDITTTRPKLRSPELTGLSKNKYYNKKSDDVSSRKLSNDSPSQKYQRKNNDLESSLVGKLFPEDGNTGHLTVLRLSSLEDLNLKSPQLRRCDKKQHSNKQNNHRNFLRLSPNDKLTLDEDMASDLSELLSDTLDELNLEQVGLRSSGLSNNKYSRRENVDASLDLSSNDRLSTNEDNLSNLSVLRLGNLDNFNVESSRLRYREPSNRRRNINLMRQENNKALKMLFDDNAARNLVPYDKQRSNKPPNNSREDKNNNNWKDTDEFSLDTLFSDKEEDYDDRLNLNDNFASDLSVLRSTNLDSFSLEPSLHENNQLSRDNNKKNYQAVLHELKSQLSSHEQKYKDEDTADILHLEFPWNGQLTPNEDKTSGLSSQSQLKNREQIDSAEDTPDILHLEFLWNDQLSPGDDKSSNLSTLSSLRSKSPLRSQEQKDRASDTNDVLHLEYPWNDPLSPDGNESNNLSALRGRKSQLRSHGQKDTAQDANMLHLEFPWNDQLSPKENKTGGLRSQSHIAETDKTETDKSRQDRDPKVYELKLEYPWNGRRSLDKDTSSKKTVTYSVDPLNQYPFPRNQNKHPNYYTQSYAESLSNEDAGLLENLKDSPTESYLTKSDSRFNENQSLRTHSITRQGLENDADIFNDLDEGPIGIISLPLDRRPQARLRTQGEDTPLYLGRRANPPLVTTTSRPNDVVSLLNSAGDKTDRKTYLAILY